MATTIEISSRSRNLGYGWTTTPQRDRAAAQPTTTPTVKGGLRSIEDEINHRQRITSGGAYYSEALFVGGRRVVAVDGIACPSPSLTIVEVIEQLREGRRLTVRVEGDDNATYSATEAAEALGISHQRVRQLAAEMNVGQRIGQRVLMFSAADLDTLRARNTRRGPAPRA